MADSTPKDDRYPPALIPTIDPTELTDAESVAAAAAIAIGRASSVIGSLSRRFAEDPTVEVASLLALAAWNAGVPRTSGDAADWILERRPDDPLALWIKAWIARIGDDAEADVAAHVRLLETLGPGPGTIRGLAQAGVRRKRADVLERAAAASPAVSEPSWAALVVGYAGLMRGRPADASASLEAVPVGAYQRHVARYHHAIANDRFGHRASALASAMEFATDHPSGVLDRWIAVLVSRLVTPGRSIAFAGAIAVAASLLLPSSRMRLMAQVILMGLCLVGTFLYRRSRARLPAGALAAARRGSGTIGGTGSFLRQMGAVLWPCLCGLYWVYIVGIDLGYLPGGARFGTSVIGVLVFATPIVVLCIAAEWEHRKALRLPPLPFFPV